LQLDYNRRNPRANNTWGTNSVHTYIQVARIILRRKGRDRENYDWTPAPEAGAGPRYTYQYLSIATNNFEKRLGGGGSGSVFQGVLTSGTLVDVKKLELGLVADGGGGAGISMTDQMRTELEVLSQVHHVNIVPLVGSRKDGMTPCLVYVLMRVVTCWTV
jgi:hypothetical protein